MIYLILIALIAALCYYYYTHFIKKHDEDRPATKSASQQRSEEDGQGQKTLKHDIGGKGRTDTLKIKYSRENVSEADDSINHSVVIELPKDALLMDLVQAIQTYRENNFKCIPYTDGKSWWKLKANSGVLAMVCDDGVGVMYSDFQKTTPVRDLGITEIVGTR